MKNKVKCQANPNTVLPWISKHVHPRLHAEALAEWKRGWKGQISFVMRRMLCDRHDGTNGVSRETQSNRSQFLYQAFQQLHDADYKIQNILNLQQKHVEYLFKFWVKEGIRASTVSDRRSKLSVFCHAIGKTGFIPKTNDLGKFGVNPADAARTTVARVDKSWTEGEFLQFKADAYAIDLRYGLVVELMWHFGLRGLEALFLNPHKADAEYLYLEPDEESHLDVEDGTKGGRPRKVPIDTSERRNLVERCKLVVLDKNDSVSGKARGKKGTKYWYQRCNKKAGAVKKGKYAHVPHGLRHSFCHRSLIEQGVNVPIKGADGNANPAVPLDRDATDKAHKKTSEILGHGRKSSIGAYAGSLRYKPPTPAIPETDAKNPEEAEEATDAAEATDADNSVDHGENAADISPDHDDTFEDSKRIEFIPKVDDVQAKRDYLKPHLKS